MYKLVFSLLIFSIALMPGCSSPELERAQSRSKVSLTGEILTQNPDLINFPVRIVIAIDDSGSMATSDPEDPVTGVPMRLQAAWNFIDSYRDFESVQFDIIHWNSTIQRTTGGFSRDFDALYEDVFTYNDSDETNYDGAIDRVRTDFINEINSMRPENNGGDTAQAANISRMRCIVLFFSDGLPDPYNDDAYTELINQVRDLKGTLIDDQGVTSFKFHAMLLSSFIRQWPNLYNQAETLMIQMASAGGGIYQDFQSSDQINFINIVDLRITVEYKIKFIVASNLNVRPGIELILTDSDGDGLADSEEDLNGNGIVDLNLDNDSEAETDPTLRDTDGDGLSDFFERKLSTIDQTFNPQDPSDSNCPNGAEYIDRDRDGLTDCEEASNTTSYTNPDTDSDGIPDGIEFMLGSDPTSNQATQDSDFDGVDDWEEVQRHTNVIINDDKVRRRYSYYYDVRDLGLVEFYNDSIYETRRRRISFDISNIDIVETLAADNRAAGDNLIRFFIAEIPHGMANAKPVYRVADIIVNYYDTASRTIEVDSFEAL